MRTRRGPVLLCLVVVGAAFVLLFSWPQAVGAQTAPVIAQVLAFRPIFTVACCVLTVCFVAVAVLRHRWGVAAVLAVVFGAVSLVNGGVLLNRGTHDDLPPGELTVVAWNTQGGAASPEAIARLVIETDADIVSLPETDTDAAARVVSIVARDGKSMVADTIYGEASDSSIPTSLLVSAELGGYRLDAAAGSTPGLPSAVWLPSDGTGPTIVAAHPMPPLAGSMGTWRAGLEWVGARCHDADVIVAGDLNATADHLSAHLGDCEDAAIETRGAAIGTWPTSLPARLSSPIDHVLVGDSWRVLGTRVLTTFDAAGSDHRPIVATLAHRGTPRNH
ncbi:MAG: endonuclease/exonuclease/phosphatase family protein [Galactobacter sp.]